MLPLKEKLRIMKTHLSLIIAFVLLTGSLTAQDKKASASLTTAIYEEEVTGNLDKAVQLYQDILKNFSNDRPVAAKALYHLGLVNEKMGKQKATEYFNRLVNSYPDQTEMAALAKAKLAALTGPPSRTPGTEMMIRRVWSGPEVDVTGSPSPDGKYLSIQDSESGDLATWDIEGGQKRRLTNKGNWSNSEMVLGSTWSPDGKKIAFAWMTKDFGLELRIIGSDGSELRTLAAVWPLCWSPDCKSVLGIIAKTNDSPEMLAVVSMADGSVKKLGTAEKPIDSWSWHASYSADGKYIVYDNQQREEFPGRDIFITSIDGKQVIPLVAHPADDQLLGWVRGSNTILFVSDRTGSQDAWALRVTDGKPQGEPVLIRKDIGQISPMGFTDGGSFYYNLGVNVVDIYEGSLDLAKGTIVEQPKKNVQHVEGTNHSAEWSSDGKYLAFVSERKAVSAMQSSYILCIRSDQTGEEREVPLPIESFWKMHWSVDNTAVFATMYDKTNQGLFKIDVQTGKLTLLARSGWSNSLIKNFAVSPDGKSVYYTNFQWTEKLVTIIRHNLETGQEKEVYRKAAPPDIGDMAISPDGNYLSFSTADSITNKGHVIRIVPTAGGETWDLLKGKLENFANHVWTPDGKTILYIEITASPKEEKRELWQIPSAGGEPQKINIGMELRDIQLHPDGRRIVFTSGTTSKEIWVMENFLPK